ncbi:MAG: phage baseplate assembly protein V [Christensenellales bacterium]
MDIRIGTVSDVNISAKRARVYFEEYEIMSDWLPVCSATPEVIGGDTSLSPWLPKIGSKVLCIYEGGFNADGYVIGGIS